MKAQTIEEYLAQGGKVTQCKPGERKPESELKYCQCGCEGNYTDHSMRLGEKGKRS